MIQAEALQRVSEEVLHGFGPVVITDEGAGRISQRAELETDNRLVAPSASERPAEQALIVAGAVEVARVEQGDTGVECGVNGGGRFLLIGGAVEVGHAHQAQSELRDNWAG
jgi:hypothetical protein